MKRLIAVGIGTLALLASGFGVASADPITCPPGQAAVLNPSNGGWICENKSGNTNNSEQTTADDQPKGKF